jgi:hypothetical protein
VSDIDCPRVLAEFNCGAATSNRNGTDYSINRDMAEISGQGDESSKDSQMSVIYNACDNEESSCCDVESGMNSSMQHSRLEQCRPSGGVRLERKMGITAFEGSQIRACGSLKEYFGEANAVVGCTAETDVVFEGGWLINKRSSTEEQNKTGSAEQIQDSGSSSPDLQPYKQQLHVREVEGPVHSHVESSALNSVETFNTFQYWRVPIPELELDITLPEMDKPTSVHVKAEVLDETTQRTFASELNADMDIDVSSSEILSYIYLVLPKVYHAPIFFSSKVTKIME